MPSPKTVAINLRIAPDKKAALAALAARQGRDTTKLILPLIDRLLMDWGSAAANNDDAERQQNPVAITAHVGTTGSGVREMGIVDGESQGDEENRINFRSLPGDGKVMKDYAAARGMKPSEFMKLLLRSWVIGDPVLPNKELNALSNTLNELGEIGRNLNQITRRIHSGDYPANESLASTVNDTLEQVLLLKEELRAVIKANIESWERNYAEPT